MNCSVRRMTPSFRLCATWVRAPVPCVSSTLPPPMSITTAAPPDTSTPYTAARWMRRASSVPEMTRTWMPVRWRMAFRNSRPLSASRTALVAAATISSTSCDSARRVNLPSAWRAASIAGSVSERPPRPPEPSRTISFSRSMISNERSGRTCTMMTWTELVPMSMAAMRMPGPVGVGKIGSNRPAAGGSLVPRSKLWERLDPSRIVAWPLHTRCGAPWSSRCRSSAGTRPPLSRARPTPCMTPAWRRGGCGSCSRCARGRCRGARSPGRAAAPAGSGARSAACARSTSLSSWWRRCRTRGCRRRGPVGLRHHLGEERAGRRRRLLASVSAGQLRKLARDVTDLIKTLDAQPSTGAWAAALATRTRRHGERVRAAVAEAGSLYASERVHEVRIAAKKLRYALEIAGASSDLETAPSTARAQVRAGHAGPPARPGGRAEPHPGDADPPRTPARVGDATRAAPRGPRRRLLPAARGLRGGAAGAPRSVHEARTRSPSGCTPRPRATAPTSGC